MRVCDREEGRRVRVYPPTPGIIVSNLSVAVRPKNEKDLERFKIADSQMLMLTHSDSETIHG